MTSILVLWAALCFQGKDPATLLEPFQGFHKEGLTPVYALFEADPQGRTLLRKAWRKLGLDGKSDLARIFSYCEPAKVTGGRRGLFMYTVDQLYRPKQEAEWRELTMNTQARLEDPQQFPVMDSKTHYSQNFEHRSLVFLPQICIAEQLTVLQTYMVLVHELTHLVGTDPFDRYDPLSFSEDYRERDYYFKELSRKGGEVDAYLAQIKAFARLKKTYQINAEMALEHFLSDKGSLYGKDRQKFMRHLLYEVGYARILDEALDIEVVNSYNMTLSWWRYFDENIEIMQRNMTNLDIALAEYEKLKDFYGEAGMPELQASQYDDLKQKRAYIYQNAKAFKAERSARLQLLDRLDERFPQE